MSVITHFKGTEKILFERKQLHGIVDFFWKNMDFTRHEVYGIMREALDKAKTVHISDMTHTQIRIIGGLFQAILEQRDIAPCSRCRHAGKRTSFGLIPCTRQGSNGYFWLEPENAIQPRRCEYVELKCAGCTGHAPGQSATGQR